MSNFSFKCVKFNDLLYLLFCEINRVVWRRAGRFSDAVTSAKESGQNGVALKIGQKVESDSEEISSTMV